MSYEKKGEWKLVIIFSWCKLSHREPASGPLAGCTLSTPETH